MKPAELRERLVPVVRPAPVTIVVPLLGGGFRSVPGKLVAVMFARGALHHLRVTDGEGILWMVPLSWLATTLEAETLTIPSHYQETSSHVVA